MTQPVSPAFIIGVDQQPAVSMGDWAKLGINAFVGVPQGHDQVQWIDAADKCNACHIAPPVTADPAAHAGNPRLLAWLFQDEPELHGVTPATLASQRLAIETLALPRQIPWMLNVDGSRVLDQQPNNPPRLDQAAYRPFMQQAHWLACDEYPITGWNGAIPFDSPIAALDRLEKWAPGKPKLMYVECSDQRLAWVPNHRCVTRAEFRALLAQATSRPWCRGIILSPWQFNGWNFDGMPGELKDELRAFAASRS